MTITQTTYILIFTSIIGLIIGSFLNVVIVRLPEILNKYWQKQETSFLSIFITALSFPRSHCPQCHTTLPYLSLVPIFSYLWQKGQCHHCQKRIPTHYLIVEILTSFLAIWAFIQYAPSWQSIFVFVFFASVLVLSVLDFQHKILPDEITLPLLWLGLLMNLSGFFVAIDQAVIGAISGYLFLWAIYKAHYLLTKKEGLGYGDFKLLAAIGAWFGWQILPIIIVLSAITALFYFLFLIATKKGYVDQSIAFGPFLSIATWLSIATPIESWWWHYLSVN